MAKIPLVNLLLKASMIGMHMVFTTLVGAVIGYFVDSFFGTKPWGLVGFIVIGVAAGFIDMFRFAKRYNDQADE